MKRHFPTSFRLALGVAALATACDGTETPDNPAGSGGASVSGGSGGTTPATGGQSSTGGSTTGGTSGGTTGTPGCNGNATPPTSPSNGYLTIDVSGTSRQYVLELPTGYDGETPQPLLFAFHGTTTDGQSFLGDYYGRVRKGAAGRVILVAPNGLVRNGQTGWIGSGGIEQVDLDFFDALVAQLKANYCVDPGRIFAMGHSAGAVISNQLGCVRGNVLRGVGPFAGGGPMTYGGATCGGKVAAFVGHNPKEGDATECAQTQSGKCDWVVDWATMGWPTVQFWTKQDGCGDIGAMPTDPFCSDPPTSPVADPTTCCKTYSGCSSAYPVTLCLYDHYDRYSGPHAFPVSWGAKAVTDFFLALPKV
jgi:poly(3-hydroxybutyrate) depolymerase